MRHRSIFAALAGIGLATASLAAEPALSGTSFKKAPYSMPVRRLDDVKAARQLDLTFKPDNEQS